MSRRLWISVCLLVTVLLLSSCASISEAETPLATTQTEGTPSETTETQIAQTPATATTEISAENLTSSATPTSAISSTTIVSPPKKTNPLPSADAFMKGMNFADWGLFDTQRPIPLYNPLQSDVSLKKLKADGTNWIALVVRVQQETIASTEITRNPNITASDSSLRHIIDQSHELGMRVMFKPHVHLSNDPNHWHGQIGSVFNEEQWQTWWASYRKMIIEYAALAQDAGADMFCIGQEMEATVLREGDWRRVAQEVRQVYKWPIICEATTFVDASISEEQKIFWWDAVDYIGVLGYFPLTYINNPTVEELKSAWVQRGYITRLEKLSQKFQNPIIISEIGYESKDGSNKMPAGYKAEAPLDLQEQADAYQAAFEVLWGKPWLQGIFWWQWFAVPSPGTNPATDTTMLIQRKPAEEVLKKYYLQK